METNKQNGSSLVEVMVALFVLAIGLLGVLALQAKSMRFNQSAHSYSQAVYLANSLAERVSVNPGQATTYIFDEDDTVSTTPECDTSGCSAGDLAEWDLSQWLDEITDTLPAGQGVVAPVPDSSNPTHLLITVSFDDSRSDSREPGEVVDGSTYSGRQEYSILVGL